jgi:predicted GNAT family acetyltransferase
MSDYTREELEQMIMEKHDEEAEAIVAAYTSSNAYLFEQDMSNTIKSSDYEMVVHKTTGSFGSMIARVHKSKTQNKQFIEIPYYWNETRDGVLVARARTSSSFSSGSYGASYTTPTLQILGTRVKDLTISQG